MVIIEKKINAVVPTNDYIFKRIFGHIGNEEITKGLIKAVIGKEVTDIQLNENPILEKSLLNEKIGILDIRATIESNIQCDIEMQVEYNENIGKRILFYWSKLYIDSISSGEDFSNLKKTIIILIAKFELKDLKEIQKFHTEWKIRESECSKVVLTQDLEFHIIELPKLNKIMSKENISEKDRKLKLWIQFLLNPEKMEEKEMISSVDNDIKLALKELKKLQQNSDEIELAEKRLLDLMCRRDNEIHKYKEGIKDGAKEGSKNEKIEIAKKLLFENFSIEKISKITELSVEEIKILAKQ